VHDFIILMLGPGDLADQVLADTAVAVTGLADWLPADDLLTAWVYAIARHQCRQYPPVVWREQQWRGLRERSANRSQHPSSVPVDVVRMALLGIAPRDRELLLLSSTYCKLMSSDLSAVFGMSTEGTAAAVAEAHQNFEQALAMSAAQVGYRRDPRSRAPEMGELVGVALDGVYRPLPADRVYYMVRAPEAARHRHEILSGIRLARQDGFPAVRPRSRSIEAGGSRHHDRSRQLDQGRPAPGDRALAPAR